MADPFRIYVGWDQREPVAYDVAKFSLERRASIPVAVTPIKLDDLRAKGLYRRDQDPLASTEFTYSRFLTPALAPAGVEATANRAGTALPQTLASAGVFLPSVQ